VRTRTQEFEVALRVGGDGQPTKNPLNADAVTVDTSSRYWMSILVTVPWRQLQAAPVAGVGFDSCRARRDAVRPLRLVTDSVPEATLTKTELGLVPEGEGWFVVNARDVTWISSEERGQDTDLEGRQEFTQLGFRIQVLLPGQRGTYHGERGQEDFLVVSGECVLVIEGQERPLPPVDTPCLRRHR
jgi:hypothetical protein